GNSNKLFKEKNWTLNAANEIEGFLFAGKDAERRFHETGKFEFVNTGGYYHSLPLDPLRQFIDTAAEVQRAMGFGNEKDHPEVAPSQFEINYGYGEVVSAADQIQLYKLLCRQIANNMGYTASFLPKPIVGVNGSGMHTMSPFRRARLTSSGMRRAKRSYPNSAGNSLIGSSPTRSIFVLFSIPASTPIAGSIRTSRRPTRSALPQSI